MKNMSIKSKLMMGFGLVVILSILLSAFAYISLTIVSGNYRNNLFYSQQRIQVAQRIQYDTMDLRRITTAIRADSGNEANQNNHRTASHALVVSINRDLNTYVELLNGDRDLTQEQIAYLMQIVEDKRTVTQRYLNDLILPNIEHGIAGDTAAAAANTVAQREAGLIAAFNDSSAGLVEYETELAEVQIAQTKQRTDRFLALFIAVAVFIAVVSVVLAITVANKISRPLLAITGNANSIAIGDIALENLDSGTEHTKSEIILLERSFSKMIESFKNQAYILARVAEGDYTAHVTIRSDKDVINLAIELMIKETLEVLNKVASAGIQVSDASRQIAEGAQQLAQGATEQAASVEELSSSMMVIADKTKESADMAGRAASLADAIKVGAERGSTQMTEMLDAIKEINQASQSISKVIKEIDDIAFQTNILALNAAVEAARAGQHGKGFAVVAEEVRNLATKSAESAKNTGELISNSMQKAQLGSRIAAETAASLEEIVSGINESTEIIKEIAASSEQQYTSITEINQGVNQVAQVVQQNSATAEESAAASEEMSSQSAVLEELIMQFNLRDDLTNRKSKKR
jgi:methyl-accepting chemotaxis protein